MDGPFDMPLICSMLKDPEIEVAEQSGRRGGKGQSPGTVKFSVDVLKDENEYARRAAVEVLNVVGTSSPSNTCWK